MSTTKPMLNPAWIGSILLGRFSAWLGFVVASIYLALFVLATTHPAVDRPALAVLNLPLMLPMVGLGLSGFGCGLAWVGRRPVTLGCVLGLMLHALALVLAAALPWVVTAG